MIVMMLVQNTYGCDVMLLLYSSGAPHDRCAISVHSIYSPFPSSDPTGLYECLIVHRKNAEFFQRGLSGWDVSYEI